MILVRAAPTLCRQGTDFYQLCTAILEPASYMELALRMTPMLEGR